MLAKCLPCEWYFGAFTYVTHPKYLVGVVGKIPDYKIIKVLLHYVVPHCIRLYGNTISGKAICIKF